MTLEEAKITEVEKTPKQITFVTNTEAKAREAQAILGNDFEVTHKKIDLDELQAVYPKDVIAAKAREAFSIIKEPVLVEDTSYHLVGMKDLPGAFVHWFLDPKEKQNGCKLICDMMKGIPDKRAFAISTICYYDGEKMAIFEGRVNGTIPNDPQGENGFGWDFIFIPDGNSQTFSQMGMRGKIRFLCVKLL